MRLKLFGGVFGLLMFAAMAAPLAGGAGTAHACLERPSICVVPNENKHVDIPLAANHGIHMAAVSTDGHAAVLFQYVTNGHGPH